MNYSEPTSKELADKTGISEEKIEFINRITEPILSLDRINEIFEYRYDTNDDYIKESHVFEDRNEMSVEEKAISYYKNDILKLLLYEFKEKQREAIFLRYGFDGKGEKTLEEVGRIMGVTRERIRQIEQKVFLRIKHSKQFNILKAFI